MNDPIRILLVDDSPYFIEAARDFLQFQESLSVVGVATDAREAISQTQELEVDIILLDLNLARSSGLGLIPIFKKNIPAVRIIVLTMMEETGYRLAALQAGADDFVPKNDMGKKLVTAIRGLMERSETGRTGDLEQATKTLYEREAQLAGIINSTTDALIMIDEEHRILLFNPAAERLFKCAASEAMGAQLDRFIPQPARAQHRDYVRTYGNSGETLRTMRTPTLELHCLRTDGTMFLSDISISQFEVNGRKRFIASIRDITERKRVEEHMRFQATLVENMHGAVVSTDAEFKIRSWNKAAEHIFGYSEEEVIGRSSREVVASEFVGISRETAIRQLMETGKWEGEVIITGKNGVKVHTSASSSVIKDSDGKVIGMLTINRDITEHKHAEEKLRESEERYRDLVENSQELICTHDLDGNILSANPAGAAMTGYSTEEILKMNIRDLLAPEVKNRFKIYIRRLKRTGKASGLMLVQTRAGEQRLWEYHNTLRTEGVPAPFVRGMARDITERKRAEDKLRESENRYQLATKATNDVIWEWDLQTDHLVWADNAQTVLGYAPEEIDPYETWWNEHIHPDDREQVLLKLSNVIAGGESIWTEEYRFLFGNGVYAHVSDRGYIERDASGRAVRMIGAMSDITKHKQAEEKIQQQLKHLNGLRQIDIAISSSFDLHITLDIVLQQALSQLDVDASAILLFNPQLQALEYAASHGFRSNALQQAKLKLGEGYAGRAVLERKTVHVPGLMQVDGKLVQALQMAKESFADYYGVPLIAKGEVKGVLEIYHRSLLKSEPEWLDFLETLAGQAAIAIDNAQLFVSLQRSNIELELAYDATIEGWSRAMDLRDKETEGHTLRVTEQSLELARLMNVSEDALVHLRRGALLHDMGKLGVPDNILLKPGTLTEEEVEIMRRHPQFASEMLSAISYLKPALDIPYCHHEKWDGSGYPRGLKGEEIPLAARIFAVVDVWDALTSDRPYRKAWSREDALAYIQEQSGRHFDPQVVTAFMQMITSPLSRPPSSRR